MEIVKLSNISKYFLLEKGLLDKTKSKTIAVDNVNFEINIGEIVGLVGESGSGKTTIAKLIVGLLSPDTGTIYIDSKQIKNYSRKMLALKMQMIFQDPFTSLNPKLTIGFILKECLLVRNSVMNKKIDNKIIIEKSKELLSSVGLQADILDAYPHQFSGGQKQRIAIARALALQPEIIIADEPVSHLDASIQAQIIKIFLELKNKFNLSYLFISHDILLVSKIADRILVMKDAKIVETATTKQIITASKNEYTKKLLNSIPGINLKNSVSQSQEVT